MPDPRSIHEFSSIESELESSTSLFLLDVETDDPDYTSGYKTGNATVAKIGEKVIHDTEYPLLIDTVDKSVTGGINENKAVIGYNYDAYDDATTYAAGDLCIYGNVLYKALQATTGNLPTNPTYWATISIADELLERPTFDTSRPAIITQGMTVFDATSIAANTEYNSSTPVAVPQIAGYTVVSITEPRAEGYYGSRMVTYLWLTSASALNYSVYNPMSNITATVKVTCRVFYIRNDLQGL